MNRDDAIDYLRRRVGLGAHRATDHWDCSLTRGR